MQSLSLFLASLFAAVSICTGSDPIPGAPQKKPIALVGGTVHTISGADIEHATILFDKGEIVAVGTAVTIPAGAEVVDVSGKHVYPGLIDAVSDIGLTEIGSVRATNDYAETGDVTPNVRAEVAVNPESELIPVARSGGVLVAGSVPSGGIVSGKAAALMLDGWTNDDLTLKSGVALIVRWPAMVFTPGRRSRVTKEEWQKQRDAQIRTLREAFAAARAYTAAKDAERGKGIPWHETDSRWEAMMPVIRRTMPVWIVANDVSQIESAVAFAEEQNVVAAVVGGRDAWRTASLLKARDLPVILTGLLDSPGRRWEGYDLVYSTPAMLRDAGVRFCISGDGSASNLRNLNHHAAVASAFGLSPAEALRAITLDAARIMGIADRVGSVEKGKDATLIVTDGDILDLPTHVERAYIRGRAVDLNDKHKQLYAKYRTKYEQLKGQR